MGGDDSLCEVFFKDKCITKWLRARGMMPACIKFLQKDSERYCLGARGVMTARWRSRAIAKRVNTEAATWARV